VSALRQIAGPFAVAPPADARVRTRLRASGDDAAVLREVGGYLGSLASADLAVRCAEGSLDTGQRARSRQLRKQELTAKSSSRWAGALTRTSEDAYQLACRNLLAERRCLLARITRIGTRLAVPAGKRAGRVRGYPSAAERHAKTIRVQALRTRLAEVERQLESGRVSVCRGGKALLGKRNNLSDAGLTEVQWRAQWESSRLFLTADGEKDKRWGNETIRWNPDQGWLEIRLPAPLARRPRGGPGVYLPLGPRALARRPAAAPPRAHRPPRGSTGDRQTRTRPAGPAAGVREPTRTRGCGTVNPGTLRDPPEDRDRNQETRHPDGPTAATRHQDRKAPTEHGRRPGDPRPFGAARQAGLAPAR
jgi:hypothetical protein